eukprot:387897-Amphidinium_carterae.1
MFIINSWCETCPQKRKTYSVLLGARHRKLQEWSSPTASDGFLCVILWRTAWVTATARNRLQQCARRIGTSVVNQAVTMTSHI